MSGYVITETTCRKMASPSSGYRVADYFLDRFSRIYSVLLAAIIITLMLDFAGSQFFPMRYGEPASFPQANGFVRLLVNLLSLQGVWGYRVQSGSDPTLWSIGYEFCYYLVFGLCVWRSRRWGLWLALIVLVAGYKIALYGLVWGLGVLAYHWRDANVKVSVILSWPLVFVANHFLEYQPIVGLPEYLCDLLFGVSVAVLVNSRPSLPQILDGLSPRMAEFGYSLYAYHMPILYLAYSFTASRSTPTVAVMVMLCIVACYALYWGTERRRGQFRGLVALLLKRGDDAVRRSTVV